MSTVVFSFGCPRSGTTFIQRMLQEGSGYIYSKIQEGRILHPINSAEGLLEIEYLFSGHNVVFVRSKRDPVKIFESFYHQREIPEIYPVREPDRNIYMYIAKEASNFALQAPFLRTPVIEINFDMLGNEHYAALVATTLLKRLPNGTGDTFRPFIKRMYMKESVRPGKLSEGVPDKKYISDKKEWEIRGVLKKMLEIPT